MYRNQEDGVVVRAQTHQQSDGITGYPRPANGLPVVRLCRTQQQVGAQHGQQRPQRIGPGFLAEPQEKGTGGGKQGGPYRSSSGQDAPASIEGGKCVGDGDHECGRRRRDEAQREFLIACDAQQQSLDQEIEERMLVNTGEACDAVGKDDVILEKGKPRRLGSLKREAFVPPQVFRSELPGDTGKCQQDQCQERGVQRKRARVFMRRRR